MQTPTETQPTTENSEPLRRSTRTRAPNPQYANYYTHLQFTELSKVEEYPPENAELIANILTHYNGMLIGMTDKQAFNFIQTHSLRQGLKKFKTTGKIAVNK